MCPSSAAPSAALSRCVHGQLENLALQGGVSCHMVSEQCLVAVDQQLFTTILL